ncbi:MAG: tetratricopeptide repeat protein [Saprospiraceae bacterium]|nr:tetratricopeptide repeat protein [Saprospiraceae bacterium]MCB0544737.1 tetratricopeptide repeat protein [Saprospiraceae bacterium]MCB0575666.1 tetratricopeptide repeat protein [Saprospiraceae bacterium]MCB9354073.1 tetratricopeptide repeat protein [Lewinellaceae bacterium]
MSISTQTPLKLIFKGRLEFGSERTYNMVLNHWNNRIENYFKTDVLLKADQVFSEEEYALTVPQQVVMSTEKHWRSTTALLKEVAQYALAGKVGAWWVQNGQILAEYNIEPQSDKTAVSEYIRGRELAKQGGMEMASEALSNAISKYERHALAYERRGYVNYKLKNFNDALYDFSKSIDINSVNPEPHYGRGKIRMLKNEWENAVQDFDNAIKRSLAVQPIHWLARLRKGDSLYHAKRYAEAIPELKFFMQRKFSESDPNHRFRPKAEYLLAECEAKLKEAGK